MKTRHIQKVIFSLMLLPVLATAAPVYTRTQLGSLGGSGWDWGPGTLSVATGINNIGQIVGYSYVTNDSAKYGFIYENGIMHNLGKDLIPQGINDHGQIITYKQLLQYQNGNITPISDLGGIDYALDINNAGQVVGIDENNGGVQGALYQNGTTQLLGDGQSMVYGINDAGQVVGASASVGGRFVYANGSMHKLDVSMSVFDINNAGHMVGNGMGAMIYKDGVEQELTWLQEDWLPDSDMHWVLFEATDINERGQILATGCRMYIGCEAVRLDPVQQNTTALPEPATGSMMLMGLAMLGYVRRGRSGAR